jgi:hypothetical protein
MAAQEIQLGLKNPNRAIGSYVDLVCGSIAGNE